MTGIPHMEPIGQKPKTIFSGRNIMVYGTLFVVSIYYLLPLYIMITTSLKGMPEVRLGNILAPPVDITFEPWVKAWSKACTGLDCNGVSQGFWNSVIITIPSVLVSTVVAGMSAYILTKWKFKGSEIFFFIIIFAIFIPMQVIMYPLLMGLRILGLSSSLSGLVVVHTIFGLPVLTLLFRNYFMGIPDDLFNAAKIDGAGFWRILIFIILPMSLPIIVVAVILQVTGIWNDYVMGVVFGSPDTYPMTVQLNNIVNSAFGVKEYNVNMASTLLTALVPLTIYLVSGKLFVRGIAAGALKG